MEKERDRDRDIESNLAIEWLSDTVDNSWQIENSSHDIEG